MRTVEMAARPLGLAERDNSRFAAQPRAVLDSIGAVVYDWDIRADALQWGANVDAVLPGFTRHSISTGANFARLLTPESQTSRALAVCGAESLDGGAGVAYRALYRMSRGSRVAVAVEDIGRWFAGADGRPARAHGVLRVLHNPDGDARVPDRDPLTGVFNRSHLVDIVSGLAAASSDEAPPFALLSLCLDGLAEINREEGYDFADAIIAQCARRIAGCIRVGDVLARCAGGRFAALLAGCDEAQAAVAARRILRVVGAAPFGGAERQTPIRLRIGASVSPRHGRNAQALLARAEEACEAARGDGAGQYLCYSARAARSETRARAVRQTDEILEALNQRRIVLAYQPVVSVNRACPSFFEALLRLQREDGSLVNPCDLLPVAERSGLIAAIDQRVLELAVARMAREPALRLSVNVSAATLRDPEWIERLSQVLRLNPGVAPRLIVEIVETAAIADVEATAALIGRIKALGAAVAMDDFGSGHTSFRNLRGLGLDMVKIDGAFVQNMARSADDRFFVRTLIDLARHVGIRTVAEWVEDDEAMRLLTNWGVDYLQGERLGQARLAEASGEIEPLRLSLSR